MPGNHLRIQTDEKRRILIVDDEMINREILRAALSEDYEVIIAENGRDAFTQIQNSEREISLILLDLLMPVMSGMEVLKRLRESRDWSKIPVIVMTADHKSEVECLELGATDFISKPYPPRDIILARTRRIIELSEDREMIHSTERDPLTGLYNREFFYNYATVFDQHHKDDPMDAIVVDITRFHLVVDRYGRVEANAILKQLGNNLRNIVQTTGGIVCRREEDIFMIYCPHRTDYSHMLSLAVKGIEDESGNTDKIRLRMGVYQNVDKTVGVEQRFDRAKAAADLLRGNYNKTIAIYDTKLHESEMFAERLTEDFKRAIREKQFKVYYQPKYDVRSEMPMLFSAEALVRWEHPELGMVNPGVFIPLFEENGMIRQLDNYVWEEAARQVREWKETYGFVTPVSVNVSRVDISDAGIVQVFKQLMEDYQLDPADLCLEVTETAYTEDEDFIITTVKALRELGLRVEMDDFGTGYSSLGMISRLPIDALKLDMVFVRNAFTGSGDIRMIELVIDIAKYLEVPVIAEGVETKEQVAVLKDMGCDIIQGYYFSKPVPADAFAAFIAEKKDMLEEQDKTDRAEGETMAEIHTDSSSLTFARIAQALAQDYFSVYYINIRTGVYREYSMQGEDHRLIPVTSGFDFFNDCREQIPDKIVPEDCDRVLALFDEQTFLHTMQSKRNYTIKYQLLIDGVPTHVSMKVMQLTDDNDHILIGLSDIDDEIYKEKEYQNAIEKSVTYASIAEALAADYFSIYYVDMETEEFIEYSSHGEYETLNIEKGGKDFFEKSRSNVLRVMHPDDLEEFLELFTKENLIKELDRNGIFMTSYRLLFDGTPSWVSMKATRMTDPKDPHVVIGVNNINIQMQREKEFEQNLEKARRAARKDVLTGVKTKLAFTEAEQNIDRAIAAGSQTPFAVAVCDVNGVKEINDTKGHKVGDQFIKDACSLICNHFKHSPVFRIGGDEFVAILQGSDYQARDTIAAQFREQNDKHLVSGDVVIACGIACWSGDKEETIEQVFQHADKAMYENKKRLKS